ncbi:MAG TPA: ribbon-helix-helix protein, CopG family [Vicinamibacterales bacterium]|nr:ribbon-helix-helix protein, CopG family [Vicinamibacterales bacterium]
MASTVVRTTYALDEETVRRLDSLARQWNVSKSEALRRAIRTADARAGSPDDRLKALDELQASMRLTRSRAQTWVREVREERRRSTARRLAKR